jgi:hypothetical protein
MERNEAARKKRGRTERRRNGKGKEGVQTKQEESEIINV